MKQKPPVEKNQEISLTIEGLTGEGQGVARVEGYTVFVSNALPGETVLGHIIKVTASYAIAKTLEVLSPSPERRTPPCPVFSRCGGCALQHLSYPAQLKSKQTQVMDALVRLGGFQEPVVLPVLGMEQPWRYRNKGSFPFGTEGGAALFGFYAERSHRLVPFADCPIQAEPTLDIARAVANWANENHISVYDEQTHKGLLRSVMARVTQEGERMAVVVTAGPLKKAEALISALDGVDSVWHNVNARDTNVLFGDAFTLLAGKPVLTETLQGLRFCVSPQSFLQVNPGQTNVLYQQAVDFLSPTPEEIVVDAYCGIGTLSLLLSRSCHHVIGIEHGPDAIRDAEENAKANGISNSEFLCGNVEDLLPEVMRSHPEVSALMLDPPRKGCEEAVLSAIVKSGIRRVVYVSCNPATLARDAQILSAGGFHLQNAQPVDMFPQTAHVETVVLMTRVDK